MNEAKSPEMFDCSTRWMVRSRTGNGKYLVEIDAYNFNGICQCTDFTTRFEKFLKRGYTGEMAVAEGWIKELRPYQINSSQSLMCWHILEARSAFTDLTLRTLAANAQKKDIASPENAAQAQDPIEPPF